MRRRHRHVAVGAFASAILLFMCLPLVVLFGVSLNAGSQQVFPPEGLSLRWFANVFSRRGFIEAMPFSVALASLATGLSLVIGTLASIAIMRIRFFGRDLLLTLLMSPLIVPQVVLGLAFLVTFASLRIHSSLLALAVLHTIMALPYAVRVIVASLTRFDTALEDAARSLGASPVRAFLLVTLPVIRPGIIAAAVFAFVASFENFTATQFLIWDRSTLPVEIFNYVQTENDPTGAAISVLVVLFAAFLVVAFYRYINLNALTQR